MQEENLTIDIGYGERKREGAVGVDFRRTASVNVVADARLLPFRDECFAHAC
jgi:hypothetical protein